MNRPGARKRLVFVAGRAEAEPVLSQLRSAGHEVSLVGDLDEAQVILKAGKFDLAAVAAGSLAKLLEEQLAWSSGEAREWRTAAIGLAHDIRSLMTALERSLAMLKMQWPGADIGPDLEGVQHSIVTLCGFLTELAGELAGEEAEGKIITIELEDLLERAAMAAYPTAVARNQRLAIDVDESVRTVRADGRKLRRILSKVLQYAARHGKDIGIVTVRACREQNDCVITVSLPGRGLTRSELRRLFAPTNGDGTPSLAYEQKLVDQVGGRLWIESQREGTSVFVSIPLASSVSASLTEA